MKVEERLFTAKDLAERMHVSSYTVIEWLRKGILKGHKYGRAWRVRESDYENFLNNPPPMGRQSQAEKARRSQP